MEQNELLDFARNFFEEMRIHTRLIDAPYPWDDAFDLNLRHTLLKYDEDVASTFFQPEEHFHEKQSCLFYQGPILVSLSVHTSSKCRTEAGAFHWPFRHRRCHPRPCAVPDGTAADP